MMYKVHGAALLGGQLQANHINGFHLIIVNLPKKCL